LCGRGAFSRRFWGWALAGAYVLLVGLPVARADYIAEAKQGTNRGYLYIGKGMTKWQGMTDWSLGDLVVRDDKKALYFVGMAQDPNRRMAPEGGAGPDAEARVAEARRQLEASGGVLPGNVSLPESTEQTLYQTEIVPYDEVKARRQLTYDRAISIRKDILAHAQSVEGAALLDIFVSGRPTWTNTGETTTIAGRHCTKYHMLMAPVFSADAWMTDELGPGYGAGLMFDKVFDVYQGGLRPLEVLSEIPGFPLKLSVQQRDVFGLGISQFEYEVLKLVETDLDEKEFGPRAGSRVFTGKFPGTED
jgi:hypothetical protein